MLRHLACIMDGNRRWAKKRALRPWLGHKEGVNTIQRVIDFCFTHSISYLSLYTFSIENLQRPDQEKNYIFSALIDQAEKQLDGFIRQGIRVRFIGERSLFPHDVLGACERIEQETAHLSSLCVQFLFCYSGRQEIIAGIKKMFAHMRDTEHSDAITQELFKQCLWSGDVPDPDLIIRTGGAQRLSNFLLFQAAYSELYFLDCLWPDLSVDDLQKAVTHFNTCKRNFGS